MRFIYYAVSMICKQKILILTPTNIEERGLQPSALQPRWLAGTGGYRLHGYCQDFRELGKKMKNFHIIEIIKNINLIIII